MLLLPGLLFFLATTLSATVTDATPLIRRYNGRNTLGFVTRLNLNADDGHSIPERDRVRVRAMMSKDRDPSVSIANVFNSYAVQVGIGEPPTNYTLMVDTGSSNTWVGGNQSRRYIPTKTSIDTRNAFNQSYNIGNVTGTEWLDTVTLSPYLVIKNQSIGVASSASDFSGFDGILGVGPVNLTIHTVNNTATVPTVMDNLYSQRTISEEVLGIYFVPSTEPDSTGELTFGGYDSSVITSPVEYVPLTKTFPAAVFWGVNQTVSYGDQTILSNAAGIIDTGTSLLLLTTHAFQNYQNLTGGVMDNATGLLAIDATQYTNLKPLSFDIGGVCLDLTPNAQIWPRSLNTAIGGNASAIYLIVADLKPIPGFSIDFINGYVFLERFYSVYDSKHQRVGFAKTAYTDSEIN